MNKKTLSIILGVMIIHILSLRIVFAENQHPNSSAHKIMLMHSERVVISETDAAKKAAVAGYIAMSTDEFISAVVAAFPKRISERPAIEADICRMSQLYQKNNSADYADKVYASLLLFAANYEGIKNTSPSDEFSSNSTFLPIYLAISYDCVYNYSCNTESIKNTVLANKNISDAVRARVSAVGDIKQYIEDNFRTMAETVYKKLEGKYANNLSGYLVRKLAGIGLILDDPDIMRYAIAVSDLAFDESQWAADGMWFEGTTSYMSQLRWNILEPVTYIINKYKDPAGYKEEKIKLGIKLDGTPLTNRWEVVALSENVNNNIFYPNGEAVAIHDTHPSYRTYIQQKKTIEQKYLENTELNHYGFIGMKSGDTKDAQETTLFFPPLASGLPFSSGHFHGNFLSMTLWAGGAELLPDAGYPVYNRGNHRYFHMNAVAHNTAWIWDSNNNSYQDYAGQFARPNLLRYDKTNKLQLAEASELMPEVFENNMNKRLLMQIQTTDNTSYTFDLQRLSGGTVHESFLRASEDENVSLQTDMSCDIEKNNLGGYLKEKKMGGIMADQTLFTDAKIYTGSSDYSFSWTGEDSGATLNGFIKGIEGMTSAFSKMPSLRRTENLVETKDDFPTYHLYRRVEAPNGAQTNYGAVYEGVRAGGEGYVKSVKWQENEDKSVIAVVDLGDYEDIIVISDNFDNKDYDAITFNCEVGYVRRRKADKKIITGYIHGGGSINANGILLNCDETFKTKAVEADENLIKLEKDLPENAVGRWSNMTFKDGSGLSHRITQVSGKTATLHNKAGFVLTDNVAEFTHFPKLYNEEKKYPMNENERLDSRSIRTAEGEISFSVPYSILCTYPDSVTGIDGEWYLDTLKKSICNITEGTPLVEIINSIKAATGFTIKVVKDGVLVKDVNDLYITGESCGKYLVCISDSVNEEWYTLCCKDFINRVDYSGADTAKKYISNTYNTKNTRNIYGTFSTYWTFNDNSTLTNEERCYAQVIKEDGNNILKIDANGNSKGSAVFAKMNYQCPVPSTNGVYSYSTKVRFSENSFVQFTGKVGNINGGKFINPSFLRFEGGKLYAGNVLIGRYESDVWYEVECIIDYGKSRLAVFVNGIKYNETAFLPSNGDKSAFSPVIEVGSSNNQNCTDIVYFDDMTVKEVYSLNACTATEKNKFSLSIDKADGGMHSASLNEQSIHPEYSYAAVFCENYADDERNSIVSSKLVGVHEMNGKEDIKIPDNLTEYYENGRIKTSAVVKLMAWDNRMLPIETEVEEIE